jgi:hypothetical protein
MPVLAIVPLADESRRDLAYRLHLLGLGGAGDDVPPSYRRAEETLRRGARVPMPAAADLPQTVEQALSGPVDARDRSWFERRAQSGEAAEVERIEGKLQVSIDGLWPRPLPTEPLALLVVSPAVRPLPLIVSRDGERPLICAGPEASPEVLVLAALVLPFVTSLEAHISAAPVPKRISAAARRFAILMVGGSLLHEAAPPTAVLDQILVSVVRDVLPPQHRGEEVERWIKQVTPLLDQPPGEIERTIHGLARRRADRGHRAWVRRFFVPRGYPLPT